MESVNVRNLEQIQEDDCGRRPSRLIPLMLASVGGAAIVVAARDERQARRSAGDQQGRRPGRAGRASEEHARASAEKLDGAR